MTPSKKNQHLQRICDYRHVAQVDSQQVKTERLR